MGKINNTKNQHYVPQGYLNNFTFDDNGKIHCFNKKRKNNFVTNIRNIGSENYFYELPKKLAEKFEEDLGYSDYNSTEKFLGMFEECAIPIIKEIIEASQKCDVIKLNGILNDIDKKGWLASYLIIQCYRTKKFREQVYSSTLANIYQKKVKFIKYKGNNLLSRLQGTKEIAEALSVLWQQLKILDLGELNKEINILLNCIWFIGVNQSEIPIITSDNPIAESYTQFNNKWIKTWSIPISTNYSLFILFDYYNGNLKYINHQLERLTKDDVLQYNKYQFEQSLNFIYCTETIKEEFVK